MPQNRAKEMFIILITFMYEVGKITNSIILFIIVTTRISLDKRTLTNSVLGAIRKLIYKRVGNLTMRKVLLLSLFTVLTSFPAFAMSGKLDGKKASVSIANGEIIFVWKDSSSYDEAHTLVKAGVHKESPELIFNLTSCVAEHGTKVIVTDSGFFSHEILVVEGENKGCRGVVNREAFRID